MPDGKKILKLAGIYGANASGKTNLLAAYNFFTDFILNGFNRMKPNGKIPVRPFAFVQDSDKGPSSFEIVFYCKTAEEENQHRYVYSITLDREQVLSEYLYWYPKTQRKLIFNREYGEITWGTDIKAPKEVASMTAKNVSLLNFAARLEVPLVTEIYHCLDSYNNTEVFCKDSDITPCLKAISENPHLKEVYLQLLSKAYFNNIKDIKVESREFPPKTLASIPPDVLDRMHSDGVDFKQWRADIIHEYDGNEYSLPLGLESDGTQRFMKLTLPLYQAVETAKILRIDEIESSLHKDLLEFFLLTFLDQCKNSQMLFTTHTLDLMDSEILRDDEIWFAFKDEHGQTSYNSIADYTGIRKGVSRKKLYEADKFGSKPIIGRMVFPKEPEE
ncbi:MAG: ATP/GTP-binding protein [Sphaerochaetaceae bacterium]